MVEGPELGADPPPPPEPPPPSDTARIIDAVTAARNTIVRTVLVATLLILVALVYLRCSDPYFRCKRMFDDNEVGGTASWTEEEFEKWDELGCSRWPGLDVG